MKKILRNTFIEISVLYFIFGIINLVRFIIIHYLYFLPRIAQSVESLEDQTQYYVASSYYFVGYKENSIKIQIYILLLSVIIGIVYSIIKYRKEKKLE